MARTTSDLPRFVIARRAEEMRDLDIGQRETFIAEGGNVSDARPRLRLRIGRRG